MGEFKALYQPIKVCVFDKYISDTIAWNTLPSALFQRLFRQDLLVASLFRNFLLAERIMRACHCSPQSHPMLPRTHEHRLWDAWDLAAEEAIAQLPDLLREGEAGGTGAGATYINSSFFSSQLHAFEVWLRHGSAAHAPPEQLPIVLQVSIFVYQKLELVTHTN